ncbi:unnamed protein product [Closterium sp. NIES-65]|nr:unnamed protein product [Closterium sp. NIES-65]
MADLGNADRPAQGTARGGNGAAPAGCDKGLIPRSNKEYLNIEYWDKRFEVEESFEWCGDYSQFKHLLLAHIRPCDRVLILGNGTSDLPECLWRDGRRHITATDLSALVVHRMAQRSTDLGSAVVCAAAPAAAPATAANTAPDAAAAAACDCTGTHAEAAAHTATGEAPGGTQPPQQHQPQPPSPSTTRVDSNGMGAVAGGREGQAQHACSGSTGSTGCAGCNTSGDSSNGCEPRSNSNSSNGGGSSGGGVVCECGRAVGITWAVADMMALPFPDAAFDVVLEKGVLDVLFVDSDSPWHVPPPTVQRVHTALSQAHRVLTPHGRLLSITFGQPHFRRPLYEASHLTWTLQHTAFGDSFHYFLLHLAKGARTPTAGDNASAADGDSESAAMAARPLAALRLSSPFTPIRIPSPIPLIRRSASPCALPCAAPRCYRLRRIRGSPSCAHLPSSAAYPVPSPLSPPIPPAQRAFPTGEAAPGGYLTRTAIAHGCAGDRRCRSGVARAAGAMAEAGGLMAEGSGEQNSGARSSEWGGGASRVRVRRVGANPTEIIDLPAESRFRASPAADGAAAEAADGIAGQIRSSIAEASSAGVPPPAVLVVPGNPGVCAYYTDFALALHSALGGAARVVVVGHVAHTEREMEGGRLYSLQHQIQHKIRFIQEEAGIAAAGNEADETAYQQQRQQQQPPQQQQQQQRWVVVGHSIGAHIAVEMRRHLPSHVVHVVGLFPFLTFNHQSDEQRRLKLIASLTPLLAVVAALLQVVRVLPARVVQWVVRRGVGKAWSHGAVHVTATAMLRYNMLRNYAYMGHTEFIYFSQREFDWAFLSSNAPHFTFIFGRDDHWGPLHLHQQMQERVPEVAAYVDEEGHEHTFCCTDRGASRIATHVAKLLRSQGTLPAT